MITTTHLPAALERSRNRGAFTLVEVMVSTALSGLVLTAVLSSFLFLGRTGVNMQNYADMETQARLAIDTFAEDVRMAKDVTWNSADSLTLTVVSSSGTTNTYTYTYTPSAGTFSRQSGATTQTLLTGITSFIFTAYQINATAIDLSNSSTLASASTLTKQVQISLRAIRSSMTVTDATNSVLSARFILRNKRVTA